MATRDKYKSEFEFVPAVVRLRDGSINKHFDDHEEQR